jgi:hypothetical protein
MTVVLRDSIQTKPLPIANAIIHMRLTRLVTAKKKMGKNHAPQTGYPGFRVFFGSRA